MSLECKNDNDYSLFQKYCENAIENLSQKCMDIFHQTKDEESRIKLLYEVAVKIPIKFNECNEKSYSIAHEEKIKGNNYFAKKDYKQALEHYNRGILKCPQKSNNDRELLTILISNRSATYYELKEFKRVFNDIDYILEIGNYPSHLQYKIWLRKAKCYDALQNESLAAEAYSQAIDSLKYSKLDVKTVKSKIYEIEIARKKYKVLGNSALVKSELSIQFSNSEIFIGGNEYISAHTKIGFREDSYLGRYAVANEDIKIGTIIIEENAHSAVIDFSHALTNCQYCFVGVDQPTACPTCANVVFCSTICERLANKTYHKVECPIQQSVFVSGASVNCSLALRIVSQKQYSYFSDKRNKLKEYLRDSCKKNVIKKKKYRFDDYDNVFFLCRNEQLRKKEELVHFSCMAIFLLRLLKVAKYFPYETEDNILTDEESYIGCLIFRHLQLLQFNAHEISELKNPPKALDTSGLLTKYENATIGAGVYPTLALFNHSCDPSIVRYNIKSKIVVRTIKPIKAGDIVYENYGPLYMTMPIEQRKAILKKNYWFDCMCTACTEMWPMFNEMRENELRIPCATKNCPFVFSVYADDEPVLCCDYCHKDISILSNLKGLMNLDQILYEAETLFAAGQLDKAMQIFINGLDILYKYTSPPHPEMIKVQQRIRICMIHSGNKAYDYKMLL